MDRSIDRYGGSNLCCCGDIYPTVTARFSLGPQSAHMCRSLYRCSQSHVTLVHSAPFANISPLPPSPLSLPFSNLAYMKAVEGEIDGSYQSLKACAGVVLRYPGLARLRCAIVRYTAPPCVRFLCLFGLVREDTVGRTGSRRRRDTSRLTFFVVCFQPSPGCTSARGQIDSTSVLFGRFWAGDELRFLPYGRPTLEPPLIAFAPPLSSRRPHLVHCMLAASHVWERELYEKIRALYNSIHPVECNLAPPFEEWTGMRGFCDHIFCRCTFLVNVAPLTKIAPVKRMQSVSM